MDLPLTRHACDRSTARNIPPGIIDLILEFGESRAARDGGRKHALSKRSMREVKHFYGRAFASALSSYRSAYVVVVRGRIVTAAFANSPLFH